ncbi:nose resistant to fluoxetine protein 6 isoform X2 [Cephus cinctus]|nr:nose resistant to fluoxetine protein 6 isoform X2 [Cephus cinctus]
MQQGYLDLISNNFMNNNDTMDLPPYEVNVNSVSLTLTIQKYGINGTHNITLGLCLPSSCTVQDVMRILMIFDKENANQIPRKITFNHVRNLSQGYSVWNDKTFYILLVVSAFVILFVIFGTLYDITLRYRVLRADEERKRNNTVLTELKILRPGVDFKEEITISKLWSVKTHNGSLNVCNSKDVPKPLSEALLSFSLLLNLSKLGSLDVGNDTLAPIHGLRFVSLLWVIMVHTCLLANEVSDNKVFRRRAEDDFLYQTISNGTYAVDTFFFMSGCLVSFLYFRTIAKQRIREMKITQGCLGQFLQFLGMMWYRYFRLTPPYLLVIGLIQVSMKWYHDHSMIELPALDHVTCEKYWWRNALYINTYFDMDDRCMVWSWYLANDTQFYTVGIILLIIAANLLPVGAVIAGVFLIVSWIVTALVTLHAKHTPTIQDPFAHYESLYDKPWTRIGPYLIGMAAGWFLFKINCKINMNKAIIVSGWTLSIATMLSIVYGLYGNMFGPTLSVMYTALSHSGWALCVSWVLIACVTGNGGIVNTFLSWKYIYPISRLTYCAYLVHPALMRAMILRGESSFHLTRGLVAILFFGVTVSSYAVSLVLSLLFEAPMVSLLRIVHPLRQWKRD